MTDACRTVAPPARPGWYTLAVAVLLALASALMYGTSDFIGGRASRRHAPVAIAMFAEVVMLPLAFVVVPLVEQDGPSARAIVWGLVAGFTGSVAVVGLYAALSRGNMTVVAPVTGVVAAIVPVAVGIADGERPGAWAVGGIALAIVAVALIGGLARAVGGRVVHPRIDLRTVALAMAVGVGFGLLFVALARTGEGSGLWPLVFQRCSGVPVLALAYLATARATGDVRGEGARRVRGVARPGVAVGALVAGGNTAYLLSTRDELLSVVAVVVSMYPAATIGLAALLDGERAARSQVVGMTLAAAALGMIAIGR